MTVLEEPARPAALGVSMRAHPPAGPRRELLLLALGSTLLAVAMSWPLVLHPGHRIAQDLGDPIRTAWQLAWTGHALLHHPLHLWQSNSFWPLGNSLAFSDSLLGYAPAGLIGHGEVAALARYNLLFVLAYALAFAGAYLLGRELGLRPLAAAVVGMAFAYAPFRSTMNGHLHVISSGGIPLSLFLLLRGYRRGRPGVAFAGWVVAAWQLSLGFTLGLQLAYLLAVLGVIVAGVWWRRGHPAPSRALATATVAGLALFAVVGVYQARPYLEVSRAHAAARRSIDQVRHYSAPPKAFLAATRQNRVWSGATARVRNSLSSPDESSLFPGVAIVILALLGVTSAVYARGLRVGLGIGVLVCAVLSLGLGIAGGRFSYRLLFDYAPGWDGVRTPGRIVTLTSLGLALLAGGGGPACRAGAARARARARGRRGAAARGARGGLVDALEAARAAGAEGADRPSLTTAPPPDPPLERPALPALVGAGVPEDLQRREHVRPAHAGSRPADDAAVPQSQVDLRAARARHPHGGAPHGPRPRAVAAPGDNRPGARRPAPGRHEARGRLRCEGQARAGSGHLRDPEEVMSSRRAGIAALVCVALAGATIVQTFSWNQTSHYALVRSIAHGTPHIDRYASETGDKARFRGHWYSSRAPGWRCSRCPRTARSPRFTRPALARRAKAERGADEMVWALTLWGAVLPGLVLLLLVRWMGERFEPGYGTAAALTLGLGTLVLPLSTLLFSHVFTACLGFGAFALLVREREGPASLLRLFVAGL